MTGCSLQKTLVMRRDARSAEEGVQEFDSCAALVQDVLMTARDEILAVLPAVCARTVDGTFTPQDVIDELRRHGSTYGALNHQNARRQSHVCQCSRPARSDVRRP
jgi:hypothetical protein